MKLVTPYTWEAVLSRDGNTAESWEKLIESGRLPFMAMVRNIRNFLRAGVSPKHHRSTPIHRQQLTLITMFVIHVEWFLIVSMILIRYLTLCSSFVCN